MKLGVHLGACRETTWHFVFKERLSTICVQHHNVHRWQWSSLYMSRNLRLSVSDIHHRDICNTHNTLVQRMNIDSSSCRVYKSDCVCVCRFVWVRCVPSVLGRPWSKCILYVWRSYLCSYNRIVSLGILLLGNLAFVTHNEGSGFYIFIRMSWQGE